MLTFGPLVGFKLGRFDVTLNPLLRTAWHSGVPDIDYAYAWRLRTGIAEMAGLGVEGYGTISDIGDPL